MYHRPLHSARRGATAIAAALAVAATAATVATSSGVAADDHQSFNHVGSFEVTDNLGALPFEHATSAEIIDVSADGHTIVYSDAFTLSIGLVDITDPASPAALGRIELGADPTSVAVVGDYLLAAVKTSGGDFVNPTGELRVFEFDGTLVDTIDLGGQPDSIAVSPDGAWVAIAIENERDEDLDDGLIPQLPAGFLQVIDTATWTPEIVELTGLADVAPSDPETEYVTINANNVAAVTLQENNHIVIVDLPTATVTGDFSAGSAAISGVDGTEEKLGPQKSGLIELTDDLGLRRREPDSIVWIDETHVVTANEGDYEDADGVEGGSRSFTVFNAFTGDVVFEAGNTFEYEVVHAGHFPESRAANKGVEPEGLEFGEFDGTPLLFVGAERANVVGVYDISDPSAPEFLQILPTGIGPEGIKAIPSRDLLVVTAETDGVDDGFAIRPIITLFQLDNEVPAYPYIESIDDVDGKPIPWVAMSGLAADPVAADTLYAVSDSYLAQSFIYEIDTSGHPALIVDRIPVGPADGMLDLEGIAVHPDGGFWLASEGRVGDRPNKIVRVAGDGTVLDTVELPAGLAAGATSSGFEGVSVTFEKGKEVVHVVVQREWADDAKGFVKIGKYEVAKDTWTFALYPLDAVESPAGGWIGLSEITPLPNGNFAIVERDNQLGPQASVKRIYEVDLEATKFMKWDQGLNVVVKTLLADVLDELDEASISIPDKLEGTAVSADGRFFMVTDNDGVDENFGETIFIELDIELEPFQQQPGEWCGRTNPGQCGTAT
ncbi:MAG TPA: esterase-like activity of phytase family protein [Ilumatobacter sp.]|nr:esterase-like activity of phytase family protein [Ilumatobacter sp.]